MGITLNQVSQASGGAAKGFETGEGMQINAQDAGIRQAAENRTARDDIYEQTFNAIQAEREQLDAIPTPGAAQAGGQEGAIPTEGGPPVPAQQSNFGSRRDAYKDWYSRASAAAATSGGLEGLKGFQNYETALSRKQMMGYGMAGVQAMAAGQAGEAVKQLNTMLEVSPEDIGMKFEAFDGKVHLVGKDGKRSAPYNQAQVMGLIESKLKTPENYLNFQEEARLQGTADEDVRAAKELEKDRDADRPIDKQKADAATSAAETSAGQLELDRKYRARETSAEEARALAALITAKNVRDRAALALAAANDWTAAQQLQIYKDADNWAMEDQELLPGVNDAFRDDPEQWGLHKSDVMNQMTGNPYDQGPTREEASIVSQFLRQPGGVDLNQYMEGGQFKNMAVGQDEETGAVIVDYNGKQWRLPWSLGMIAIKKIPQGKPPPEDASAQTDEVEATQSALPVDAWRQTGGGGKEEPPPTTAAPTSGIPTGQESPWGIKAAGKVNSTVDWMRKQGSPQGR